MVDGMRTTHHGTARVNLPTRVAVFFAHTRLDFRSIRALLVALSYRNARSVSKERALLIGSAGPPAIVSVMLDWPN